MKSNLYCPYETDSLSHYDRKRLLKEAALNKYEYGVEDIIVDLCSKALHTVGVTGSESIKATREMIRNHRVVLIYRTDSLFPKSTQPIYDEDYGVVYIDARPFLRIENGEVKMLRANQLGFALLTACLIAKSTDRKNRRWIIANSHVPVSIYANWLANSIRMRCNVGQDKIKIIQAIAALYFYCTIMGPDETAELFASRAGKMNLVAKIEQYVTKGGNMDNSPIIAVNAFSAHLSEVIKDKRPLRLGHMLLALSRAEDIGPVLAKLNMQVFPTMVSSAFRGLEPQETALVAVEHPETFVAITAMVSFDSVQRKMSFYRNGIATPRNKLERNYFQNLIA